MKVDRAAVPESQGTFLTPQTLMTFPGATMVIGVVWKVVESLMPSWEGDLLVPAAISLAIGGFIYFVGVTDPDARMTKRDMAIGAVIACFNTVYLFAVTTGIVMAIDTTASGSGAVAGG